MSRRSVVRSGSSVDAEVANLFKLQNKSQFTNALLHLRQRYRDEDLVNRIQEVFMEKHSSIVRSAKKFAMAVRNKYASQNVPFHQLLMKARAHAKKHHLSDAEFAEFQRIYEQELAGTNSSEVVIPMTNIMKVLGNISGGNEAYFNVNDADYKNLQEILKLHDMSKQLHAQVLLQAIQYAGVDNTYLQTIRFDPKLNNPADHVHPVIAALFLPKFKTVDHHFVYSNMSGIIKSRYNHQPLTTRPDYELFYNLVTDPNDVVCDTRTPFADLLHRCNLQNQLWNSVLHVRNGQLYNPSLREFTASVDVCRLNKYDNPDFVYGRHDGTILKRLFSAFSYRPTVVATLPVASLFAYNPYSQNMRPVVTSIPMINVRLSSFGTSAAASNPTIAALSGAAPSAGSTTGVKLVDTLTQTNLFLEGSAVVPRHTSVMFSREIIVFYIDRRSYMYATNNSLTNLARLPTSIAGFERINDMKLDLDSGALKVANDMFYLQSAVIAQTNPNIDPNAPANYVIGSEAILFNKPTLVAAATATTPATFNHDISTAIKYSPGTIINRKLTGGDLGKPIIPPTGSAAGAGDAYDPTKEVASKGIILIYVNPGYNDNISQLQF